MSGPIIWPLAAKLAQPIFMQKRPIWTGGLAIPSLPVLPWNDSDRPPSIAFGQVEYAATAADTLPVGFAQCALGTVSVPLAQFLQPRRPRATAEWARIPAVVRAKPPAVFFQIGGQTKDSTGAALGGCTVGLFVTATGVRIETAVSNADGYFYFKSPAQAATHYVVAYLAGSPDVAGTTLNTLVGA
jgi:hypothetical protein